MREDVRPMSRSPKWQIASQCEGLLSEKFMQVSGATGAAPRTGSLGGDRQGIELAILFIEEVGQVSVRSFLLGSFGDRQPQRFG